ncbi:MAG TPA: AAA family ATPase, partial [Candidatus Nesterenkonia stercoripullorum]|nr:AAA family ATPase [Candidatus Nesterenkonia stercoripullorum]
VVEVPDDIAEPVYAVLRGAVLCTEAAAARQLLQHEGVTTVVTTAGEIVRRGHREGGTASVHHEISITAQIQQLTQTREQTQARQEQLRTLITQAEAQIRESEAQVNETLEALHASDADLHATTERLGRLRTDISTAQERLRAAEEEAAAAREAEGRGRAEHAAAQSRLEAAREDDTEEDPSTDDRDRLAETASARRQREVDARLTLRAGEDRHSQLGERAAALRRSAQAEESRAAQARALAQDRRMRAAEAEAVQAEAEDAVVSLDDTLRRSAAAREAAQAAHAGLAAEITDVSRRRQEQAERADGITSQLHAAELARTELRLSLEAAESRGREELSLSPEYLIEHYGPDQLIPDQALPADAVNDHAVNDHAVPDHTAGGQAGDADPAGAAPQAQEPAGKAFDRGEQEKRLAAARKDLSALGKVNPLALEEHAALEERHRYLQEQLADLTSTRKDLLGIIDDIDRTVEQVFREAWEDTRVQFEHVFARLFPGGEGRLELTDPDDMLNTGIEVHARPPGKRIRRLSLLSGGERSLTAVALLVAIFKARPSPFYVMDEVEAALDDTNLSRLLVVFEELRESSQLIVITHQKRTMEVADALYGVSMRQDGSTRVISQRLERQESTP